MEAVLDAPLSDAEAEAAVIALAGSFKWAFCSDCNPRTFYAMTDDGIRYTVMLKAKRKSGDLYTAHAAKVHFSKADHSSYRWGWLLTKMSVNAAKAACERHHATGKWV